MENHTRQTSSATAAAIFAENSRLKLRLKKLASLFRSSQELIEIQSLKLEQSSQHVATLTKQLKREGPRFDDCSSAASPLPPRPQNCFVEPLRRPKLVSREVQVFDQEKLELENQLEAQTSEIKALRAERDQTKAELAQLQKKLENASKQSQRQAQSFENTKAHLELQIKQFEEGLRVQSAAAETSKTYVEYQPSKKRQKQASSVRSASKKCFSAEFCSTNLKGSTRTVSGTKTLFRSKTVVLTGEFELFDSKDEVKRRVVSCGGRVVGSISGRTDFLVCGSILQDGRPVCDGNKYKEAQARNIRVLTEHELKEILEDMNHMPKPSTKAAKVECVDVIRDKKLRCELPGHTCEKCANFYNAIDKSMLTEAQKKDLVQDMSRHRYHSSPPPTPPHFWSLPSLSTP